MVDTFEIRRIAVVLFLVLPVESSTPAKSARVTLLAIVRNMLAVKTD